MNELINIADQDYCFFGIGSSFKGSFKLKGKTHLSSDIEGDLLMEGEHSLVIEREGQFKGQIQCSNLEIYGSIEGEINSTGNIIIYPSARVDATINSKSLTIYPGAIVNMTGKAES